MDPSAYKTSTVTRGLKYNYYFASPTASKPVLLFLHGFPSTSYDWRHQIHFFKNQGYGLIVPDMLGYGGTDKPTDPQLYAPSLICKDVIDILDAEKVEQAVVIGHDWGSVIASRLANYYADRFAAFAFLAVGYTAPRPGTRFEDILAYTKEAFGYELFGYWAYFSEENANIAVEAKLESFYSLLLADDSQLWVSHFAPSGAFKSWIEADQRAPPAAYVSDEEKRIQMEVIRQGGLAGPFCWYKTVTSNISSDDAKSIPLDKYTVNKPVFFGGATKDYVALSAAGKASVAQFCKGALTVREFDVGHWVIWAAKDELNKELLAWIEGVESSL